MSGPHTVGLRLGATLKFTLLCHAFAIVTPLQRKLWRKVISAKYFRQWWNSVIPHFYTSRTTFILCIITQHDFDEKEDQTWLYISSLKIVNRLLIQSLFLLTLLLQSVEPSTGPARLHHITKGFIFLQSCFLLDALASLKTMVKIK